MKQPKFLSLNFLGGLLLFMMVVLPYQFSFIKLFLSFFISVWILVIYSKPIHKKENKFSPILLYWCILYWIMSCIYFCYGLILDNPGPTKYFLIYCIWPLLFISFIYPIDKTRFFLIIKLLRYCFFIISLLGIIVCIYFNVNLLVSGELLGFDAVIRPGFPIIAISSGSVISIIFLYPFFLSLYLLGIDKKTTFDRISLIIGFIFVFLTSRRALYLNILFTFFMCYLFLLFSPSNQRKIYLKSYLKSAKKVFIIVGLFFISNIYWEIINFNDLIQFVGDIFGNAVTKEASGSYDARIEQYNSLIQGWLQAPIIGNGTGVNASVVRSETVPGMYELTYVALLFERGFVGFTIYIIQFLLLFLISIFAIHKSKVYNSYLIAACVGFFLFMFANGTNPYLYAFDHYWILYLFIAIINLSTYRK